MSVFSMAAWATEKNVTDQEHKNHQQGSGMDPALPDPTSTLH